MEIQPILSDTLQSLNDEQTLIALTFHQSDMIPSLFG